jgi:hypothetical protein
MHPCFVKENNVTTIALKKLIGLGNIDGSPSHSGSITHYAVLKVLVDGHLTQSLFHIANISSKDAILEIDWLQWHNPAVDWSTDSMSFPLCPLCLAQKPMLGKVETPLEPNNILTKNHYPLPLASDIINQLVTNQLVTCGSGPDPVSPEPSPTYDHPPDRRPATCTRRAPAQALADPPPRLLIDGALSARPNIASAPTLIWRHPRDLPRSSAGAPLRGASSGFLYHIGSIAAIPLTMTPVQLVLTPVRLTDSLGLTPIVSPEL